MQKKVVRTPNDTMAKLICMSKIVQSPSACCRAMHQKNECAHKRIRTDYLYRYQAWVEHVNKTEVAAARAKPRRIEGYSHTCLSPDEIPCCGIALVSVAGTDGCVRLYDAVGAPAMIWLSQLICGSCAI